MDLQLSRVLAADSQPKLRRSGQREIAQSAQLPLNSPQMAPPYPSWAVCDPIGIRIIVSQPTQNSVAGGKADGAEVAGAAPPAPLTRANSRRMRAWACGCHQICQH